MNQKWIVSNESDELGISGYVSELEHPAKRIYNKHGLLCILKGTLACEYDGTAFDLQDGGMLFIPEGKTFSYTPFSCTILFFTIPVTCFPESQGEIRFCTADSESDIPYKPIRKVLGEIIHTQFEGGIHYTFRLQSLWKECFYLLLTGFLTDTGYRKSDFHTAFKGNKKQEQDFAEILDILNRSYMEPLQLKDLADSFYYTPSHLSRLFMKYTGQNFMEYLTGLRLQKAMPLLLRTMQEIRDIAEKTGFPNTRAFSQAFHARYHMNPSDYRRQLVQDFPMENASQIRNNIIKLYQQDIFRVLLKESSPEVRENASTGIIHSGNKTVNWRQVGAFSYQSQGTPIRISEKNKVLNIPRLRDLLLDDVQDQIRMIQKEMHFEYINCHGFLSDDMQIYSTDVQFGDCSCKYEYNFMLYEKILRFVQSLSMKIIIQLGNTPSFLSPSVSGERLHDGSTLSLPASMDEWSQYLENLFSSLQRTLGPWFTECPLILCPGMEFAVNCQGDNIEEHLAFYLKTYRIIRKLLPANPIMSPVISCSNDGMSFIRQYLAFCRQNNCMPEEINLRYAKHTQTQRSLFRIRPLELHYFQAELRNQLNLLKYPADIPINLLEFYYSLRFDPVVDSSVGAQFPIQMLLAHHYQFEKFGFWFTSDCTTEGMVSSPLFFGGRGFLNRLGGKKATYYAFHFLSRLGHTLIEEGDGYMITKEGNEIRMLLYYVIPEAEWKIPFSPEQILQFYSFYPDRSLHLRITDLPADTALIQEEIVHYKIDSSYENWVLNGCASLESGNAFSVVPAFRIQKPETSEGILRYQAHMYPFELRFVTIKPL